MKEKKLHHFEIAQGLSEANIAQLIDYSQNDPRIKQFTRDSERFKDKEAVETFLQNARVYALTDNEKLNGIIWFSPKPLPQKEYTKSLDKDAYDITFAIRLYEGAEGKGLSLPFMKEVFTHYQQETGSQTIWLEVKENNEKAVHLYQKFGFEQISNPDPDGRIVMVTPF
jgi:ribosomal protein S18 acetylase RimI-like enzyme